MQIAVAAAAAAVASAHNYRQMLRQLSVSFASTGGGELWRHSICVTFAAATVAAVCCCCCRRLIRKTLWNLKYCGVRGICCCPGVAMGTGSSSKGAEGGGRWEEGGKTGDRQQVGNLSSRRGEINVSIGNQHLYLPAWHLASSGKRVAINEAGNNKNKLPTAHNLRSTISTSLVSLCVMRVLPLESAIRSSAEQVLRACTLHIA